MFKFKIKIETSHIINSCIKLLSLQMQQWPNSKLNFLMKLLNYFKQDMLLCMLICGGKTYD
jgi:hypothetical protein